MSPSFTSRVVSFRVLGGRKNAVRCACRCRSALEWDTIAASASLTLAGRSLNGSKIYVVSSSSNAQFRSELPQNCWTWTVDNRIWAVENAVHNVLWDWRGWSHGIRGSWEKGPLAWFASCAELFKSLKRRKRRLIYVESWQKLPFLDLYFPLLLLVRSDFLCILMLNLFVLL